MNKPVLWLILGVGVVVAAVFVLDRSLHHYEQHAELSPAQVMRQQAARDAERRARTLAPDQQCVAGTVVTVRPNYASQMIRNGQPVHCKGRLADIPIH